MGKYPIPWLLCSQKEMQISQRRDAKVPSGINGRSEFVFDPVYMITEGLK